jgi:hypothetical protein
VTRRALAGLVVGLLLFGPGAAAQPPPAERPTYAVGDTWVLTGATYRVARATRDGYVFAAGDREIWLTRDLAITYVKQGSQTLEIQEPLSLPWPLQVGKRGVGYSVVRLPSITIDVHAFWWIEATERVTVPGGTFEAFRIRAAFDPDIPGRFGSQSATQVHGRAARDAAFEVTWWYAAVPRRIVLAT